jgi:hypothetical protein
MAVGHVLVPDLVWWVEVIVRNIGWLPWIVLMVAPGTSWESRKLFTAFGVQWRCRKDVWLWWAAGLLRYCGPPPLALFSTGLAIIYYGARARNCAYYTLDQFLFPENTKVVWVVPHAVSCALCEYANGTTAEVVVTTCRGKLLRLATLPLPDVMHAALLAGTEEVTKFLASSEPFFEEGATFATSPL